MAVIALACWEGLPTIAGVVTAVGASLALVLREWAAVVAARLAARKAIDG